MRLLMTALVAGLAASAAVCGACGAAEPKREPLKVLMIGNSFSICNLKCMPQIAMALDRPLDLASLYIGGCTLERHWQNVVAATNASFRPYRLDRVTDGRRLVNGGAANVPDALRLAAWDVVTIQQASHLSWDPKSYEPFGSDLIAAIRRLAPQAKVVFQETWSYPPWDARLRRFGFDQLDMYAQLHDASRSFAHRHGLSVIPTGTAAEFAPDRNALFTKPDFHFNRVGEYLQGLVWAATLFDVDVTACAYRPDGLDAARADELKRAAMEAVRGPAFARRGFRDARLTRGDTNLRKVQPIDEASWLWTADDAGLSSGAEAISHRPRTGRETSQVRVFRRRFEVKPGDGLLVLDVSADERFYLTVDGAFVARGPNRADVENWQYQTYCLDLPAGTHEVRAVVTRLGGDAPLAQLSWRGGFILKANGVYDARLTTGKAAWEVGRYTGMRPNGSDNGVWGTGSQFEIVGSGPFVGEPDAWRAPVVVRGPAASRTLADPIHGGRTPGWMLFPSQLPDQTEALVRPGAVRAATHEAGWRAHHPYRESETKAPEVEAFNRLLRGEVEKVSVPARTRLQLAWHLGRYICAYPQLKTAGGKGARVSWTWTESARDAQTKRKGDRSEIVGKFVEGYGDTFISDGRADAVFSAPWFRCGLWCRLDVETGDEPLEIRDLALVESRYPVEMESAFASPDDQTLPDIRRICARAMQMCCHEMLFDCPYYEQQMYPGDTRVQLLVLSALSRDDRIVKRAMEIYDLATRDDGQCPFNYPTRGTQEGFTYTLCYLAMFGDYAMNHADFDWLRARLPGLRKSMAGCEVYENAKGLVEGTPGWNFMDWTTEWGDSAPPNTVHGTALNSFSNLFWLLAMQSAATAERALGNELQARYWEEKAARLKLRVVETFWSDERGLLADTPMKTGFSEHSQALAILTDCLPADKRDVCFRHLVSDEGLSRTTVYFNYYLFEAYFKMGRADLFLKRLDLWRDYVKLGVTTLLEMPDSGKTGSLEARSDCHAWGAHPIWFMQTGLAGIRSAAPGFAQVRVAPQPGPLTALTARHPHPQGWIEADLSFDGARATGTVTTPVPGTFAFGGRSVALKPGVNRVACGGAAD